jgi:hypothetical protein
VIVSFRALDRATPMNYYRIVDQQTLVVGTVTGPASWTRVVGVAETPSTITITVSSLDAPVPGTDVGYPLELTVKLVYPIGGKTVLDGSSGGIVPLTRCLPPTYLAPGCT